MPFSPSAMPLCRAVDPPVLTFIRPVSQLNLRSYPGQSGQRHTVQSPSVWPVHWWKGIGAALGAGWGRSVRSLKSRDKAQRKSRKNKNKAQKTNFIAKTVYYFA